MLFLLPPNFRSIHVGSHGRNVETININLFQDRDRASISEDVPYYSAEKTKFCIGCRLPPQQLWKVICCGILFSQLSDQVVVVNTVLVVYRMGSKVQCGCSRRPSFCHDWFCRRVLPIHINVLKALARISLFEDDIKKWAVGRKVRFNKCPNEDTDKGIQEARYLYIEFPT